MTPETSEETGLFNRWGGKIALLFNYIHLSHDLAVGLLVALLPFIRQDMGLSYLQSGLLISAYSVTSGISQVFWGLLSDRFSRKTAIALGLAGVGLSAAASGLATSYYPLLAILVVMGLFSGAYHPSATPIITGIFDAKRRGKAIGVHLIGGSIGFGLGPIVGAGIAGMSSWHHAYVLLSLPALAGSALVLTHLRIPETVRRPAGPASASARNTAQSFIGTGRVFRSIAEILFFSVTLQLIFGPVQSFIPLYLVDHYHLSPAAAATWMGIMRSGGIAGGLFGGWLTDKCGRKPAIFFPIVVTGPLLLLLANLDYTPLLGAVMILAGAMSSMRETTMQTFLMESTPPELRSTVFGIYFAFGQEGSSLAQPVAGAFMDIVGIANVYAGIAYISMGLSLLAAFRARKVVRRETPHWA